MNALKLVSRIARSRRLVMALGIACGVAAASAGRAALIPLPHFIPPPIANRTFDLHESAVGPVVGELTIQQVTGTGPWSIAGNLQFNGQAARPIAGQMVRQPQGGYALSFVYQANAAIRLSFQGAVQADNQTDPNSPILIAGQWFSNQIPTVFNPNTGPHPFYAINGGGGVIL